MAAQSRQFICTVQDSQLNTTYLFQGTICTDMYFSVVCRKETEVEQSFFVGRKEVIVMAGRPPKWTTPEELQKDIDKYFDECKKSPKAMIKAYNDLKK